MLRAKIAECWELDKQADGSYFIDADPQIFKHVLRFLRHGVYPLCCDMTTGHDLGLYMAIHRQADFLLVPKLSDWLSKQQYFKAVTIDTSAEIAENLYSLFGSNDSDTRVHYHPSWRNIKKFVCPRRIGLHYGNPGNCGRACKQAQGDAEDEFEDVPVLSTLVLKQKLVLNQGLCVEQ